MEFQRSDLLEVRPLKKSHHAAEPRGVERTPKARHYCARASCRQSAWLASATVLVGTLPEPSSSNGFLPRTSEVHSCRHAVENPDRTMLTTSQIRTLVTRMTRVANKARHQPKNSAFMPMTKQTTLISRFRDTPCRVPIHANVISSEMSFLDTAPR